MSDSSEKFLLKNLLYALNWFDEGLQNHLVANGWPRTSRTKTMILIHVSDGVTRPIQIARNLGVSRPAVHAALAEMERDGLVVLEPDPDDRRATRVRYADDLRGRRIRNDAIEVLRMLEGELEARFGKRSFREFKRVLLSDWGPPRAPDTD